MYTSVDLIPEPLKSAAIFYLKYNGSRGTDKQVLKLVNQMSVLVFKLASDRGWKRPSLSVDDRGALVITQTGAFK